MAIFNSVNAFDQDGTAVNIRLDENFVLVSDTDSASIVLNFLVNNGNLLIRQSSGKPVQLSTFGPGLGEAEMTLLSQAYLDISEMVCRGNSFVMLTLPGDEKPNISISLKTKGVNYFASLSWERH